MRSSDERFWGGQRVLFTLVAVGGVACAVVAFLFLRADLDRDRGEKVDDHTRAWSDLAQQTATDMGRDLDVMAIFAATEDAQLHDAFAEVGELMIAGGQVLNLNSVAVVAPGETGVTVIESTGDLRSLASLDGETAQLLTVAGEELRVLDVVEDDDGRYLTAFRDVPGADGHHEAHVVIGEVRLPPLGAIPVLVDGGLHSEAVLELVRDDGSEVLLGMSAPSSTPSGSVVELEVPFGADRVRLTVSASGHTASGWARALPWVVAIGLLVVTLVALRVIRHLALRADAANRRSEQMEEAAAEIRQILLSSTDHLVAVDAETQAMTFLNDEGMIGYDIDYFSTFETAADLVVLLHEDDTELLIESWWRVLEERSEAGETTEIRLLTAEGEYRWMLARIRVSHVASDGTPLRLLLTLTDVDDRHRAEEEQKRLAEELQQSQKLQAIGQLAARVAHQFNNLLASINAHADLLGDAVDDERQSDISEIRRATTRGALLTSQLLVFSDDQRGRAEPVDLNVAVGNVERILSDELEPGLRLETDLHGEPMVVLAAPTALEQILIDLVMNAREATTAHGRIRVATGVVEIDGADRDVDLEPGSYGVVTVSDEGSGIPEGSIEKVFDPFFTTKEAGRSGLGLTTARGLIEKWHGRITVDSEPGVGTTVQFFVPLHAVENEPVGDDETRRTDPSETTVLIVDDEDPVRNAVSRILERSGFTVAQSSSADEAASRFQPEDFDVLLTDVAMPGMDGTELAAHFRERRPDLPVILMSGYSSSDALKQGVNVESFPMLLKPFEREELLDALGAALDGPMLSVGS